MNIAIAILVVLFGGLQVCASDLHDLVVRGDRAGVDDLLTHGRDVNETTYNDFAPLHLAEDPAMVELLLRYKPDLNAVAIEGTPLQQAASKIARRGAETDKQRKIIKLLLDAGARYDIISAIHLDDIKRVRAILNKDPKAAMGPPSNMDSPLRVAASEGREDICKLLLKNKADPEDTKRGHGYTILQEAVKYPVVVKLLIDAGADVNERITWRGGRTGGWIIGDDATALHYAAGEGVPETVKILIDEGVDIFATALEPGDESVRQTALEVAATFGKSDTAKAILDHPKFDKGDATVRKRILAKSLVIGATFGSYPESNAERPKLVEALLDKGADPNGREKSKTAIQVAASEMWPTQSEENRSILKTVAILRQHGAKLDLCSAVAIGDEGEVKRLLSENPKSAGDRFPDGYPALDFAVDMDYKNVVTALLKAGCDVNIRNRSEEIGGAGETALQSAAFWGRDNLAKLLVNSGADVNAKYDQGGTPLSEAVRLHNSGMVRLLLEHGAKLDGISGENANPEIRRIFDEFRAKAK